MLKVASIARRYTVEAEYGTAEKASRNWQPWQTS